MNVNLAELFKFKILKLIKGNQVLKNLVNGEIGIKYGLLMDISKKQMEIFWGSYFLLKQGIQEFVQAHIQMKSKMFKDFNKQVLQGYYL